jgi:hypothetical protein
MLEVSSVEEVESALAAGLSRRRFSETRPNRHSSRSHVLFSLVVEATNTITGVESRGKLTLVDLAGSERVNRSEVTGEELKEAAAINSSLSALGDVVSALIGSQPPVPYNTHKLTKLLSDSLGGNAKTVVVVTLSPEVADLPESHNSLQYATRVGKVQNTPRRSWADREVQRLRAEVEYWRAQAGLPEEVRQRWDLTDIVDAREDEEAQVESD